MPKIRYSVDIVIRKNLGKGISVKLIRMCISNY